MAVPAQTADRVRRVGFLNTSHEEDAEAAKRLAAFKLRLQELGWTDGKNVKIDVRFGRNNGELLRQAAAALTEAAPDVIVSTTSTATRALMALTTKIPIVAAVTGDPVALGFTRSLSRPSGNMTGFTTLNDTVVEKQLGLLREIVPAMQVAALMWVQRNPQQVLLEMQTRKAAQTIGVELLSLPITSPDDIAPALAMAKSKHAAAIMVAAEPLTLVNGRAIIEGCVALRLPAIHTYVFEAKNGALMSYGYDPVESFRLTAEYVDRILRGTKIADLPFQEPTRLKLAINLRTARAIGISVPLTLLALADEVIE
jgi:putative tryptophan/tyrosine transport system substrate-binding protein